MKVAIFVVLAAAAAGAVVFVVRRRSAVRNVERDTNTGAGHF